jgi:hypothetical protein
MCCDLLTSNWYNQRLPFTEICVEMLINMDTFSKFTFKIDSYNCY